MDPLRCQLVTGVTGPPRSVVRSRMGSSPCAGFLADRSFEAVEVLRHCLLVFFFLVERIIINR